MEVELFLEEVPTRTWVVPQPQRELELFHHHPTHPRGQEQTQPWTQGRKKLQPFSQKIST